MKNLKEEIQIAVNFFKAGNLSKAEKLSKKLIKENPKVTFLYNLLGLINAKQNKFEKAKDYYENGIKIDPHFAMLYNNLGLLYSNKNHEDNFQKAENYFKKALSIDNKITEPYVNMGSLYNSLNRYDEAIRSYSKAIDLNPNLTFAHYNLGILYINLGQLEKAKSHLIKTISIDPTFSSAQRSLSRLINYKEQTNIFKKLIEVYKITTIKENKIDLCFALGKAYEDKADYDNSFKFYKEGNAIQREIINFSITEEIKKIKKIKNIFTKDKIKNNCILGCDSKKPIFIVGMPRSGTTLIEQIISSHPIVFGADEIEYLPELIKKNFKKFESTAQFDRGYLKSIGNEYVDKINIISNQAKRITDKLPINFLWIGFIKLILPNAKIIHCSRNPKDNIFSIFKNHFPGNKIKFAYSLSEIVDFYNIYSSLMKHWNNILPNFIYNIKYEDLILNTKIEIENLLKYCDLSWNEKCLKFYENKRAVKTASNSQVRNKIYKKSINSWENYEKNLSEYFKRLSN